MSAGYLLFIGLCLICPAFQNVGMGFQKWSIDKTPPARGMKKAMWIGVWILGLLFQLGGVTLGFKALTLGNASTLAAFGGTGLIYLSLFSYFVLKEEILKKEMIGIGIIIISTAVVGIFSSASQDPEVELETLRVAATLGVYLVFVAAGVFVLFRNLEMYGGAILGMIAGSMNGFGILFQKVVTAEFKGMELVAGSTLLKLLSFPYTWLMIIGGVGGFVVVQFGYKYGKAVQVVPSFAATIIMIPTLAGMTMLNETVPPLCLLSVAVIVIGAIITTTAAPSKHKQ